jgi:DNA mismatch endonuclease (patch repair protein)
MSRVRNAGNRSTEGKVEAKLIDAGIDGWEKHPKSILGRPDFFFARYNLALFVDGCFWHGCPVCDRRMPAVRGDFWREKILTNKARDDRQRRKLRRQGYRVMRVWEHELGSDRWLKRLDSMVRRGGGQTRLPEGLSAAESGGDAGAT